MIRTIIHLEVSCKDNHACYFYWTGTLPYPLRSGDLISFCNTPDCACEDAIGPPRVAVDLPPEFKVSEQTLYCWLDTLDWGDDEKDDVVRHFVDAGFSVE